MTDRHTAQNQSSIITTAHPEITSFSTGDKTNHASSELTLFSTRRVSFAQVYDSPASLEMNATYSARYAQMSLPYNESDGKQDEEADSISSRKKHEKTQHKSVGVAHVVLYPGTDAYNCFTE
uniref:AlNc14C161G7788 protein n=1 Tax=Albugo laibachii Nc14 TaxID=890382 RepID=F0WMV2_9STRA|nr:AlNc14C161G7788 [Albugo laibachii Nc14]|eukprot:CCA22637.1 AlNc14C161G7788 [Albugo laibachii Nc14]